MSENEEQELSQSLKHQSATTRVNVTIFDVPGNAQGEAGLGILLDAEALSFSKATTPVQFRARQSTS